MLTIKEASKFLGVSIPTLRRWESEKRITSERTEGGHRRYDKNMLISLKNKRDNIKLTIGYCRVSTSNQKEDLERQVTTVSNYCSANGYQFRIIQDLGSGLNYNKKGLKELISLVCEREIDRIVVYYKDRLIRYGYEIIEELCELNGVRIEVINHTDDKTYEQELVDDALSIITAVSSKLYGSRSHMVKQIEEQSKEMFREVK